MQASLAMDAMLITATLSRHSDCVLKVPRLPTGLFPLVVCSLLTLSWNLATDSTQLIRNISIAGFVV